jgi:pimeloyl-ACP methyl ester carboxylesterase
MGVVRLVWSPARLAGIAIVSVAVLPIAVNALAYVRAARARRRWGTVCPDDEGRPLASRVHGFLTECAATWLLLAVVLSAWRRVPRVRSTRPVIVLHTHGAPAGRLLRRLRGAGFDPHPVGCSRLLGGIETNATRLARAVDRARTACDADHVDVVAHGLGGLVARAYLRRSGTAGSIGRLVTLGTPHEGPVARQWAGFDDGDQLPPWIELVSIFSGDDAFVVPPARGYHPDAFNVEVAGVGHLSLLVSGRVFELVRENLVADDGVTPSRSHG